MKDLAILNSKLPEGWAIKPLGILVCPSKEKVEPETFPDALYVSLEHIEQETGQILGTGVSADVCSTKAVFRNGDVLYGKLRPYLNKVCIPPFDGICSTDILVFPKAEHLEASFLMRFLMQRTVVEYAHHHSAGVQLPRVSFSKLAELEFPVPPIAEQKRIVAKVEELLARVNAARARLAKIPLLLKRFRQSVLAAACSGQLTAEWRDEHADTTPVTTLLDNLAPERRACWQKRNPRRKYVPPLRVAPEELPEIPAPWAWTNFDHCSWEITVGHVGPMKNRYVDSGIPFLRSQNVRPLRFSPEGLVFIEPDFHGSLRKSALYGGEILVTRSGANTGDCCVYPEDAREANCADLVITRPLSGLLPQYGAIYVSSPDGQARIGLRETGMAQPHFNIGAMRVKAFPLPPTSEQQEIVRRVDALFALADKIEARVQTATARVEKITQAILAKAFRGELVPTEAELARQEGRDYESADQLLARIKARSANNEASPKPVRKRAKNAGRPARNRKAKKNA